MGRRLDLVDLAAPRGFKQQLASLFECRPLSSRLEVFAEKLGNIVQRPQLGAVNELDPPREIAVVVGRLGAACHCAIFLYALDD